MCFDSQAGLAARGSLPPIALLFQHLNRVPSPESDLVRVLSVDVSYRIVSCWVVVAERQCWRNHGNWTGGVNLSTVREPCRGAPLL